MPSKSPSRADLSFARQLGSLGMDCLAKGGVVIEASQERDLGFLMRLDPATANGVCKALSLYWIGMHAKEESFWSWIGTQGAINTLNGQRVMATFLSYGTHLDSFDAANPTSSDAEYEAQKDVWANGVLAPYKVVPYTTATRKGLAKMSGGRDVVAKLHFFAENNADIYMQLSLGGSAGRHAVSFYVGWKDICFYDPNFGEYWFPKKGDIRFWFETFMRVSGYAAALGDNFTMRYYKVG